MKGSRTGPRPSRTTGKVCWLVTPCLSDRPRKERCSSPERLASFYAPDSPDYPGFAADKSAVSPDYPERQPGPRSFDGGEPLRAALLVGSDVLGGAFDQRDL